jgi:hypothetical protein
MITFEVHPEIHVRELRDHPSFSTCSECHRSFHAKNEAVISVHVRPPVVHPFRGKAVALAVRTSFCVAVAF